MLDRAGPKKTPPKAASWRQDPERVRRDILDVAREEFAEKGLSGARVDEIAARTSTAKRMIYYYFGDKEGLYLAVLEAAYGRMRAAEVSLDLATMSPVEALGRLAGLAFDYHVANPDFVRLVMVENIHRARHLQVSKVIGELNLSAIRTISEIYDRGVAEGDFRPGLDPLDIHLTFTAPAFYNVSNRATIREVFGHDMGDAEALRRRRQSVIEAVLRFVAL
jgi:AcrR family transcriptional regulator